MFILLNMKQIYELLLHKLQKFISDFLIFDFKIKQSIAIFDSFISLILIGLGSLILYICINSLLLYYCYYIINIIYNQIEIYYISILILCIIISQ